MVAEPWIVKMGNQVSANLKQALLEPSKNKNNSNNKQTIGILSFEVANIMSKTIYLHKSLSDSAISKLKNEILSSDGVKNLVSSDDVHLLELVVLEKLEDLNRVANVVSRLGRKCSQPALQGFKHVYLDIINGAINVKELGFLVKDMEGMMRKMERFVNVTANLYTEMEVLNELEQAAKKFQNNQHEQTRKAYEQKLLWQKQDVGHLKEISLWNQTFDKVVELLVRTVCTVYARIHHVRIDAESMESKRVFIERGHGARRGSSFKSQVSSKRSEVPLFDDFNFPCGTNPGRVLMDCLSLSSSGDEDSYVDHDDPSCQRSGRSIRNSGSSQVQFSVPFGVDLRQANNGGNFGFKSRLLSVYAPVSTVGGSALALHYANIIIVIEKLLRYPHLVGDEARDDLYEMLPTSLRSSLKTHLKSYVKNMAIYDAPLAHDWKETLDGILSWLAPLAHNMIRWQTERNFEQHQIVTRTNVLLIQTLYFADRKKAEEAICELLVGLNYICRYEHQQNALLDCASSFDFEDCMEWQLQCKASYLT
ncbi:Protein PSK SIMULATOR 1, partial [Cucurbita argyrosperma subsp. sororia]